MTYFRLLPVLLALSGCGLDLASSNDDPRLNPDRGTATTARMVWSVRNGFGREVRWDLRAASGVTWTFVVPAASGDLVASMDQVIECGNGELVCSVFDAAPGAQPYAWPMDGLRSGDQCYVCGMGNVILRFGAH